MFGLGILDFILSLSFIFFLLSIIASWIFELISILFNKKSNQLKSILSDMIGGKNIAGEDKKTDLLEKLYEHPVIREYTKKGKNPECIPENKFGLVVLDILKNLNNKDPDKKFDIREIKKAVNNIKNEDVRQKLLLFIQAAETADDQLNVKLAAVQKHFDDWFNDMMRRAKALYKRYASIIMFFIGLGIAGVLNIDSIQITTSLWNNSTLRETVIQSATQYMKDSISDETDENEKHFDIYTALNRLNLFPVGWNTYILPDNDSDAFLWNMVVSILFKIVGIIISALAISQGGPFWYEILIKITKVREFIKPKDLG